MYINSEMSRRIILNSTKLVVPKYHQASLDYGNVYQSSAQFGPWYEKQAVTGSLILAAFFCLDVYFKS